MHNYQLTIQYDGGRYKGWQRLGSEENTIQGKLEAVLSQMFSEEIEINGCSRTDAGVHALAQVANFKSDKEFSTDQIKQYLNQYLPQDISVTKAGTASESFHARYNAKDKTYLYQIWNREYSNPFLRKYSMHVSEPLDIEAMKEAASHFLGAHDFTAFSNAKSKKKSMVREIYSIDITTSDDTAVSSTTIVGAAEEGNTAAEGSTAKGTAANGLISIRLRGNSFLYNMARWMVGSLIEVGLGKMKAGDIPDIIVSKERNRTGNLAEACGLYLEKITYE